MADSIISQNYKHGLHLTELMENGFPLYGQEVVALKILLTHLDFLILNLPKLSLADNTLSDEILSEIKRELVEASRCIERVKGQLEISV